MKLPLFLLLAATAVLPEGLVDAKKIQRVQAGKFYRENDPVQIVVNKVGPFNNPTETYKYYSLPFCAEHSTKEEEKETAQKLAVELPEQSSSLRNAGGQQHRQRLGESIVGDRRMSSPYEVSFMKSVEWRLLCKKKLSTKDLAKFKDVIHNNYFFEMFIEDLPMWGYIGDTEDENILVGEVDGSKTFLFPHLKFHIGYNKNQIVGVNVTTDVSPRWERL